MRVLLTSFGITRSRSEFSSESNALFYRMPPVDMRVPQPTFALDLTALLLADKVVLDSGTMEALQGKPHRLYKEVAEAVRALYEAGFVELVDFARVLDEHKGFLGAMTASDLTDPARWEDCLTEAFERWVLFLDNVDDPHLRNIRNGLVHGSDLRQMLMLSRQVIVAIRPSRHFVPAVPDGDWPRAKSHRGRPPTPNRAREQLTETPLGQTVLREYLEYVNANLILANELDAGFCDWVDFAPFYRRKFQGVGHADAPVEERAGQLRKLFAVSFPQLELGSVDKLIRALSDPRIVELRALVERAVRGEVTFDEAFARDTLLEVLHAEQKRFQLVHLVSYLTLPLSLFGLGGTALTQALQEVVGQSISARLQKPHSWFYLLSDVGRLPDRAQQ